MFKLVILFSFVAACSCFAGLSSVLGPTNKYYVDVGYKYIKVANPQGDVVNFVVDNFYGYTGPQNIFVHFYGQVVGEKYVQVSDQQSGYTQMPQSDILYQIFRNYEGAIDDLEYQKLINIVSSYVQNEQISHVILYALQALAGQYEVLTYFSQYQQTPYYQGMWNQWSPGYGSNLYYQNQYNNPGYNLGAFGGCGCPYNSVYHLLHSKYGITYPPQQYYGGRGYEYDGKVHDSQYPYQYGKRLLGLYYAQQYPQHFAGSLPYISKSYTYGSSYPRQFSPDYYGPYVSGYQYARQYAW